MAVNTAPAVPVKKLPTVAKSMIASYALRRETLTDLPPPTVADVDDDGEPQATRPTRVYGSESLTVDRHPRVAPGA